MSVRQLVIAAIFLFSFTSISGQVANAILIAIDKYPAESGWNEIHATNDLKILKPMLHKQGFLDKNIIVLTNEQAKKATIVKALQRIALISRPADHVYIHFSCHGQQMADDNGDEVDGLDESLIPYDAPRRYLKGVYEGEKHLRDDELGLLLDAIRRKLGSKGSVVLALDACHSGTGDRDYDDDTYVRGTAYVFAPANFDGTECDDKPFIKHIVTHPSMSALTVIAACHPSQLNYEYRCPSSGIYYGSLTYALSRVFKGNTPTSINAFRVALSKQMSNIKPRRGKAQTPLLQTSDEKRVFKIGL